MVPRYVNHWPPTAPPTLILRYVLIATAFGNARIPLLKHEIELATAKGLAIMTLCCRLSSMSRPVSVRVSHGEIAGRDDHHVGTLVAFFETVLRLERPFALRRQRAGWNCPRRRLRGGLRRPIDDSPKMPNSGMADHATAAILATTRRPPLRESRDLRDQQLIPLR
jgi:hypothetical protein